MNSVAEKFFAKNQTLPTMPEIASKLLRSFDDDNLSLGNLSSIISKDPTLSAKVLRLANSARYSPSHNISSLPDAAAALGMDMLRNLSMAACVCGAFPEAHGFSRDKFWRHSLNSAGYCKLFARAMHIDDETSYLAGLMIRTGQLLMAATDPTAVAETERLCDAPGTRFSHELAYFGCTHSDVTACLATHWHFPETLIEAFQNTTNPLDALPFSPLAASLRFSEIFADSLELGVDPISAIKTSLPDLLRHVSLDLDKLSPKIIEAGDFGSDADLFLR